MTNDFTDITGRFDVKVIDLVVFGGQVPPDRKAELREEIGTINPQVIFVHVLAGIPGLIINQVQGAFTVDQRDASFVPPDPKSDSLLLLGDQLAGGDHSLPVPEHVPPKAAFATVRVEAAIYAFSIATEQ